MRASHEGAGEMRGYETRIHPKRLLEAREIVRTMVVSRLDAAVALPAAERGWFVDFSDDAEHPLPSIQHTLSWEGFCNRVHPDMPDVERSERLYQLSRAMETETKILDLEAEGHDRTTAVELYVDQKASQVLAAAQVLELEAQRAFLN